MKRFGGATEPGSVWSEVIRLEFAEFGAGDSDRHFKDASLFSFHVWNAHTTHATAYPWLAESGCGSAS